MGTHLLKVSTICHLGKSSFEIYIIKTKNHCWRDDRYAPSDKNNIRVIGRSNQFSWKDEAFKSPNLVWGMLWGVVCKGGRRKGGGREEEEMV